MGFLITDTPGVRRIANRQEGNHPVLCSFPAPCAPCCNSGIMAFGCAQTRECICIRQRDEQVISRMPAVPGLQEMCLSSCGRFLYQLSTEADCVHTRSVATGELLFAAPSGVFPRMMQISHDLLLVAGGAVCEAYVFHLPDLQCLRIIHTRHPCFAAGIYKEGYVLVCASEGEAIHTIVYTLAHRALRPRKLTQLPGLPGTLCICPDGVHALLTTADGLMKIELSSGELIWNRPEWALSMRIQIRGAEALVSDTLTGQVCILNHHRPWKSDILYTGSQPQACFLEKG